MSEKKLNLLDSKEVLRWCYEPITEASLVNSGNAVQLKEANDIERAWARAVIGGEGNQWTTMLCQDLVIEALIRLGRKNVRTTTSKKSSLRDKKYDPDIECDDYVYEVKGRSWTTPGTAGEKILGVPLKYGEVPRLYHKPLQIILVGYQEYEAKEGFAFGDLLDASKQTPELQESLAFYKEHGIEYIGFTDILKKIGLPYGCWDK